MGTTTKEHEMEELLNKINAEIAEFQLNARTQVEKGVKAAGARSRKGSLTLAALLKEWRKLSVAV